MEVMSNGFTGEFSQQLVELQKQTELLFGKNPPDIKPSFACRGGIIYFDMPLDSNGIVIDTDENDGVDYTMNSAQAKAINRALAKTNGNVSQAARLLGIQRSTIYLHTKVEEKKKRIA